MLIFSYRLGGDRADRVIQSEPVLLKKQGVRGTTFATGSAGIIIAITGEAEYDRDEQRFVLIGTSGEELLRSHEDLTAPIGDAGQPNS